MYERRRGERPQEPESLPAMDGALRSADWLHLGQSLAEPPQQVYQGMVGPPGSEALIFLFMNVVAWLTAGADIFIDGTRKVSRRTPASQMLAIVTSWMDHVSAKNGFRQ